MKKFFKILFITVFCLLAAGAGAAWYFLKDLDVNKYKPDIAKAAMEATGRELAIDGDIEVKISLNPALIINKIRFANAEFAQNKDMVKAERIEAQLSILPLFTKKISIAKFILIKPEIYLEKNEKGNASWDFAPVKTVEADKEPLKTAQQEPKEEIKQNEKNGSPLPVDVDIKKFLIQNALFVYDDAQMKQKYNVAVNHFELATESMNSPLKLDFEVVLDNKQINGNGTLGRINDLLAGGRTPYPFDLKFNAGGLDLAVKGSVVEPLNEAAFDVEVVANVEDVQKTAKFAGVDIPKLGSLNTLVKAEGAVKPLKASVKDLNVTFKSLDNLTLNVSGKVEDVIALNGIDVKIASNAESLGKTLKVFDNGLAKIGKFDLSIQASDRGDKINIDDIKVAAGNSDLSGRIIIDKDFKNIVIDLKSNQVDLSEIIASKDTGKKVASKDAGKTAKVVAEKKTAKSDRVIPNIKIPFEDLKKHNVNVTYNINNCVLPEGQKVKNVAVKAGLNNGSFRINNIKADIGDGSLMTSLIFNASSGKAARVRFKVSGNNVVIPEVYKGNETFNISEGGKTNVDINLSGYGTDLRSILGSLDGNIVIVLEESRLSSSFLDWFAKDITSEILGLMGTGSTKDALLAKCMVIRLDASKGVLKTEKGIVLQGDKVNFVTSGAIDLGNESLDISFMPQANKGMKIGVAQAVTKLIKIKGSFANPKVGLDAINTAKTAVTVGAALATGGLSALGQALAGSVTETDDLCYNALSGTIYSNKFKPTKKETNPNDNAAQELINDISEGIGGFLKKLK